jgi:hypothetical protein
MKKCFMLNALLFVAAFGLHAQSYSVDWFKVAGGGGTSSGGQYSVTGTIGQPEAGVAISGGYFYSVIGGFWSLVAALQTPGAPTLTITFVGPNSVVVSWPSAATGFVLQQNSDLTTTSWSDFGGTVSDDGTSKSVTISLLAGYLFFRLNHPSFGAVVRTLWSALRMTL